MSSFTEPLELEFLNGRQWRLTNRFEYYTGTTRDDPFGEVIRIPAGFITDFASIPRGLWNFLPPAGSYGKAAVVHDWLYRHGGRVVHSPRDGDIHPTWRVFSRSEVDRIFLQAMEVLGVSRFTRNVIYAGVRVGGWASWRANQEAGAEVWW